MMVREDYLISGQKKNCNQKDMLATGSHMYHLRTELTDKKSYGFESVKHILKMKLCASDTLAIAKVYKILLKLNIVHH